MKFNISLLLILVSCLLSTSSIAQDCPTNLVILDENGLQNFINTYPDCTVIRGNLTIRSNVSDLSLLSNITSIQGELNITGLNVDLDASGLSNVTEVLRGVTITDCKDISQLLTGLESTPSIEFVDNDNNQISGFDALQTVNDDFVVRLCDNLTLPTFSSLSEIGSLNVKGDVKVENKFDVLRTINGDMELSTTDSNLSFPTLRSVASTIEIRFMSEPFTIDGFNQLTTVGEELHLANNDGLTSINGFNSLRTLAGDFTLTFNPQLKSVIGFEDLQINSGEAIFQIHANGLEDIDICRNSTIRNESVIITFNQQLKTLKGFGGTLDANTELNISNNLTLESLEIFNGVRDFRGHISIITSTDIDTEATIFQAVENIQSAGVAGFIFDDSSFGSLRTASEGLSIEGVEDIPTLPNLVEVGDDLFLASNSEINACPILVSIDGDLTVNSEIVRGFNKLENVDQLTFSKSITKLIDGFNSLKTRNILLFGEFEELEEIGGFNGLETLTTLTFSENQKLSTITGFENLTEVSNTLSFQQNPELTSIPNFNNITGEMDRLIFRDNDKLEILNGFNSVETLNLQSSSQHILFLFRTITGFNSVKTITSDFNLTSDILEKIDGFESLELIEGDLNYGEMTWQAKKYYHPPIQIK